VDFSAGEFQKTGLKPLAKTTCCQYVSGNKAARTLSMSAGVRL
jgi:biotin operon repressor